MFNIKPHQSGKIILGLIIGAVLVLVAILATLSLTSTKRVAGAAGPTQSYSEVSFGGINYSYQEAGISSGNVNRAGLCVIKSPSATSTLVAGSIGFRSNATSSALTLNIWHALGLGYQGTSTTGSPLVMIASSSIGAYASTTVLFATTTDNTTVSGNAARVNADRIFGPNQYIVASTTSFVGTTSASTNLLQGSCQAEFMYSYN